MFSRVLLVWPPPQLKTIAAALVCLAMAGCTTMPTVDRARIVDVPLASAHSNIAFTVTTGYRHRPACGEETSCPSQSDEVAAMRFARQVQRVADALQNGARSLYPDLARRAPGLVDRRFDVYLIEGDELGSASSANGRIALNEAFGALRPYDELLAFVIAREMGHVIARHHEENSAASIATSALLTVLIPGSGLLKHAISVAGSEVAARSKAEVQALEADAIALDLLRAAGFRLRDVALSLPVSPTLPDDGRWSKSFRESSGQLLAELRRTEFDIASVTWQARTGRAPATSTDN